MGWILLALGTGYLIGWCMAHDEVARECERLGGFYVGKRVFKCVSVEQAGRKAMESLQK